MAEATKYARYTNTEPKTSTQDTGSTYRRTRASACRLESRSRQYDFVMHHMTTKGDKAIQPLSLSLERSVANYRWLLCSFPSTTGPPNQAYQALLHFLQDSVFFVKAWIQEVHLSLPKAFNERDTQRARNILQVLNPAKIIEMVSECKPDSQMPKTTPIKSVETEKIQRQAWIWKMIN